MLVMKSGFVSLLLALMLVGGAAQAALSLYVSPEGDDSATGRRHAPSAERNDGPLATLEEAQDRIRAMKEGRRGLPETGVIVHVCGGDYLRTATFELTAEDSGMRTAPIVYRACDHDRDIPMAPGASAGVQQPRLLGGRILESFAPVTDEAVLQRLPEAAREQVVQADLHAAGIEDLGTLKPRGFGRGGQPMALELFFDGAPQTLARWPNEDWTRITGVPDGSDGGKFQYEGDRPEGWAESDDIWVHGYWTWDWADSFAHIAALDKDTRTITTSEPHGVYGYKEGARFYFLNVLEELDEPGEYYVDRDTGMLYFWPPSAVDEVEVAVSLLEEPLITMEEVEHVSIEGLRLEYTRGTAARMNGGAHSRIAHCTFANIGGNALTISGGEHSGALGNHMYHLGYGGISLTGGDRQTLEPAKLYAISNHIHDFSLAVRTYTAAVQVNGVGNLVQHNLIHDAPHMAIGLGGNDHLIEYNEIFRVCMETHDAGAFYMGRDWTQRGNIVRYNFMHQLGSGDVQAVYLDDWTSGTLVYGNILHGARRGVLNGGGRDNIVENNIFVDCTTAVHIDERGKGWAAYYFDGTTPTLFERLEAVNGTEGVYAKRYPELAVLLEDDPISAKGNVVARNISVNSRFLDLHNGLTEETPYLDIRDNWTEGDPGFVDAAGLDFTLSPDTPVYEAIGFRPIPMEKIGLLDREVPEEARVRGDYRLDNVFPPFENADDPRSYHRYAPGELPLADTPFVEHVRVDIELPDGVKPASVIHSRRGLQFLSTANAIFLRNSDGEWEQTSAVRTEGEGAFLGAPRHTLRQVTSPPPSDVQAWPPGHYFRAVDTATTPLRGRRIVWVASGLGLYRDGEIHPEYGVNGPLSTQIRALAVDSERSLWVGTQLGLSVREIEGKWRHIRGGEGLPYEDITAIAVHREPWRRGGPQPRPDTLWIGTTKGAIHYRPHAEGRQWFYRQGERYLPDDHVLDVTVSPDGKTAYFLTEAGLSAIEEREMTIHEKAERIEEIVNLRHRRLGLVADATFPDPDDLSEYRIGDNDNDGLWTAYHVAAMSLAYAVTGEERHLESAKESMHALVMLQNASGVPGLVARSVLPPEEGAQKGPQWRPTPDGSMYWKSDTSSDEIDGHYLAFYAYWEHIARHIPEERDLIIQQVRDLTNYIVDNDYLLIDWTGERTRWGFWQPRMLNEQPEHYLERGLNSLQMLSFLKVAHHITGDAKFKEHYDYLITEHGYLNNVLTQKMVFPDENNHSDNQLGYVAWYPILQLEHDPAVRPALQNAVRRHYKVIARDSSSFFYFVTATIDRDYVNIEDAVQNLREIPLDRRQYRMENSHRADVQFDPYVDRFGRGQLMEVLPADERNFSKWNQNPYVPDAGAGGHLEDDGAHYLLPYWMARYHGFLAAP